MACPKISLSRVLRRIDLFNDESTLSVFYHVRAIENVDLQLFYLRKWYLMVFVSSDTQICPIIIGISITLQLLCWMIKFEVYFNSLIKVRTSSRKTEIDNDKWLCVNWHQPTSHSTRCPTNMCQTLVSVYRQVPEAQNNISCWLYNTMS